MRKVEKAAAKQSDNAQTNNANGNQTAPANTRKIPEPPPGAEDVDAGDVEEVIKLDEGDTISGEYRGHKVTRGAKPGETSQLHKLVCDDGISRGIWGTVQLNAMLAKIKTGERVWIAYVGKEPLAGGNEMHVWRVAKLPARDDNELPF